MMTCLSTPVWEGYPGAATRVLLPMTLAFNVLVPRSPRWWPVLLAGNLTVAASVFAFSPPHDFYQIRGDSELRNTLRVLPAAGWHGPERHLDQRWRWGGERAELRLVNTGTEPIALVVQAKASAVTEPRLLRVSVGERMMWSETVRGTPRDLRFGFTLPVGETTLIFATDRPAEKVGTDPRALAFRVANVKLFVAQAPSGARRP
jgi:hypothetical protein